MVPSGQAEGFDLCGGSVVNGAQNTEKIPNNVSERMFSESVVMDVDVWNIWF